jgi:hypothetical protein
MALDKGDDYGSCSRRFIFAEGLPLPPLFAERMTWLSAKAAFAEGLALGKARP